MGNLKILMLSGKSGCGKDTFFELSKNLFPSLNIIRFSFADQVKEIALEIGWDGVKDAKGIDFLQKISFAAREYDDQIWLKKIDKILLPLKESTNVAILIVTDCRYENQIDYVKKIDNSTIAIRIERKTDNNLTILQKQHPTEISLDNYEKFDYFIENDTIDNFKNQIINLINKIAYE